MSPPLDREPSEAERVAVRARPWGLPAGYQEWRRLLFVHWPVPLAVLRPLVPASLSIDRYAGVAYVSLVAFCVQAARPLGAPRWLGLDFLETNVRTYVHLAGHEPGVYFFSLDASSLLGVVGARAGLGLPYRLAHGDERRISGEVVYQLGRACGSRPDLRARYQPGEPVGPAAAGTLDFFLVERYLLHVQRGPTLWSVQVHHRPYPLHQVRVLELDERLVLADGVLRPDSQPLAHFSPGVDVEVFAPRVRVAL